MPTWRTYIYNKKNSDFVKTSYYLNWNSLLNNKRLNDFLNQNNIKIVFYPHFRMQKYIELFNFSNNIMLADYEHYKVPSLLKEASLLITDYSSIFFDFAYMKKPVIYFQFDRDDFFSKHYQKGYFDFNTMGFGEVVGDADAACKAIIEQVTSNYVLKKKYEDRVNRFFPVRDNNNCKRIFQAIESLERQ